MGNLHVIRIFLIRGIPVDSQEVTYRVPKWRIGGRGRELIAEQGDCCTCPETQVDSEGGLAVSAAVGAILPSGSVRLPKKSAMASCSFNARTLTSGFHRKLVDVRQEDQVRRTDRNEKGIAPIFESADRMFTTEIRDTIYD